MDTFMYLLLSLAYLVLLVQGIRLAKRDLRNIGNVLLAIILALLYDNGILFLGKYIGEGELLKTLNLARYWLHALITPLLVLFAWNTLVRARIKWANKNSMKWVAIILTLSFILIEFFTVVRRITLKATWKYGVLSYDNISGGNVPPLMIIGVSLVLLITSIIIWRRQKWPWLFLGIFVIGLAPMFHFVKTDTLHNLSEFILMLSLLATKAYHGSIQIS
jgi:hypothetical protein